MKEILRIFIRGEPCPFPKPSARATPNGKGGWMAQVYHRSTYPKDDPQGRGGHKLPYVLWKEKIIREVRSAYPHAPTDRPVWLQCDFWFPRPQRLMTKNSPPGAIPHISKPDLDNLMKLVKDALTGDKETWQGVWNDDSQVYKYPVASKHYVKQGDAPGVFIIVEIEEAAEVALFEETPAPAKTKQTEKPSMFPLGEWVHWRDPALGDLEGTVESTSGGVGEVLTVSLGGNGIAMRVDSYVLGVTRGRLPKPTGRPKAGAM